MNQQLKTVLLTVLTLSVFVIAMVELSGVSRTALFNKYGIGEDHDHIHANAGTQGTVPDMPRTSIEFTDTRHDFGTITEGEIVRHAFHFKNTGEHPLLITKAVASCGCTVPEWPKEPIQPGGEGDIMVEFNSNKRTGHQQKNVLIYSNAQMEAISIGFTAEVKEK